MTKYSSIGINKLLTAIARGEGRKLREKLRNEYRWYKPSLYGYDDGERRNTYVGIETLSLNELLNDAATREEGEHVPEGLVPYLSHTIDREIETADYERFLVLLIKRTRMELLNSEFITNRKKKTRDYFLAIFDGWISGTPQIEAARNLNISRERVRQISNSLLTVPVVQEFVSILQEHRGRRSCWRRNPDRKHGAVLYQVKENELR